MVDQETEKVNQEPEKVETPKRGRGRPKKNKGKMSSAEESGGEGKVKQEKQEDIKESVEKGVEETRVLLGEAEVREDGGGDTVDDMETEGSVQEEAVKEPDIKKEEGKKELVEGGKSWTDAIWGHSEVPGDVTKEEIKQEKHVDIELGVEKVEMEQEVGKVQLEEEVKKELVDEKTEIVDEKKEDWKVESEEAVCDQDTLASESSTPSVSGSGSRSISPDAEVRNQDTDTRNPDAEARTPGSSRKSSRIRQITEGGTPGRRETKGVRRRKTGEDKGEAPSPGEELPLIPKGFLEQKKKLEEEKGREGQEGAVVMGPEEKKEIESKLKMFRRIHENHYLCPRKVS